MAYEIHEHHDWRGRDGTAFHISMPGGDWTYIYAGRDKGACAYESNRARFTISRAHASDIVRKARGDGASILARRYVFVGEIGQ